MNSKPLANLYIYKLYWLYFVTVLFSTFGCGCGATDITDDYITWRPWFDSQQWNVPGLLWNLISLLSHHFQCKKYIVTKRIEYIFIIIKRHINNINFIQCLTQYFYYSNLKFPLCLIFLLLLFSSFRSLLLKLSILPDWSKSWEPSSKAAFFFCLNTNLINCFSQRKCKDYC